METFSVVFSKGRQLKCNNNQLGIYSDLLLGGDSYPLTKGLWLMCTVLVFSITSHILECCDEMNCHFAPFMRQGFVQPDSKVKLERRWAVIPEKSCIQVKRRPSCHLNDSCVIHHPAFVARIATHFPSTACLYFPVLASCVQGALLFAISQQSFCFGVQHPLYKLSQLFHRLVWLPLFVFALAHTRSPCYHISWKAF